MKKWCWLIGHRDIEGFTDGGYPVCSCGVHSYWDYDDFYKSGIIYLPYRLWNKMVMQFPIDQIYSKCCDCKKIDFLLGKRFGNHNSCMPF